MNRDRRLADTLALVLGGLCIVLLSLPATGKVRGLKAVVSYLLHPVPLYGGGAVGVVAQAPSDVSRLLSVDGENRRLRREVEEAALLRAELLSLRRENARLTDELGISSSVPRDHRWARVVERDPALWHNSVMVSAGSVDGVQRDSPVLGLERGRLGVVGRVTEVGERVSKVLLLSDPLSAVAAYIPSRSWEGLIQGQGTSRLRLNYLPVEAQFTVGDAVYTSPTSVSFPPDLAIGHISRVFPRDPFLAFQSVEISPVVHAAALREVLILSPGPRSRS